MLAAWQDMPLDVFVGDAREHWHVEAEVVRGAFSETWKGWKPDTTDARPLDDTEPALVLISGELHARYVPARRDRARGHHRTEYFLRLRPLRERGTLDGSSPLASVLTSARTSRRTGRALRARG